MRIILVGVACVGKSTIGKLLAEIMGYKFFDFDIEVEERMREHISSIKKRTLAFNDEKGYRDEVKHILDDILSKNKDKIVIAMPPGGLFQSYSAIINKHSDVLTIALKDKAENILERLTFYDDESKPIYNVLNKRNKPLYLREIKKDIEYFSRIYRKAKLHFNIEGMTANDAAHALLNKIQQPID
jgi:shikimate kinase